MSGFKVGDVVRFNERARSSVNLKKLENAKLTIHDIGTVLEYDPGRYKVESQDLPQDMQSGVRVEFFRTQARWWVIEGYLSLV